MLFAQRCAFCHGANARGASGPGLITSDVVLGDDHGEHLAVFLKTGRPDKGMPSFKMTPDQISDISAFLHGRVRDIRYRQLYHVKEFSGDVRAGEAYFTQTGRCASCHSVTGDLNHIAAKYEPEVLLGRMLYPAPRRSQPSPRTEVTVTVTLASGNRSPDL